MHITSFHSSFLTLLLLFFFSASVFADARITSWEELKPDSNIEFDDPIAQLSPEQLRNLRTIVRIRWLIANGKSEPDGVSAREEQHLVQHLSNQGIDVDWLLSQREEMAKQRQKQLESTGSRLLGATIRIPGYVMPLFPEQTEVQDFLLVPWVAPCAHFPPPVANQVIRVTIDPGMAQRDRFDPVWIEGVLSRDPSEYNLFLADGMSHIEADYTLQGKFIGEYSAQQSDVLTVGTKTSSGSEQSWYQALQMRVTHLFTQTMTAIRDGDSSTPIWFGLLLAFGYGVLHTLGPGHGKAVVISYFVGHGGSLIRGIRMGTLIAVCHVLSAVIVVGLTSFAIRQVTGQAPADFVAVRLISYATIGCIGAFMLWGAVREMRPKKTPLSLATIEQLNHNHNHHGCCTCSSVSTNNDTLIGWLAVAVGAVPCTGAILVLMFGLSHNLLIPAILMVMLISLGMALAMSCIGICAILGRNFAERKFNNKSDMMNRFNKGLKVATGLVILLIGVGFFTFTLNEKMQLDFLQTTGGSLIMEWRSAVCSSS